MNISKSSISFLSVLLLMVFLPKFIFSQSCGREASDDGYIYDIVEPKTLEIVTDFYLEKYTLGSSQQGKKGNAENQTDLEYFNSPILTLRYGIIKNLELQLITGYTGVITDGQANFKTKNSISISTAKDESGISGLGLGFKAGLLANKNIRPSVAFSGIFTLPKTGSEAFTPEKVGIDLGLNFHNVICDKIDIAYNIETIWSGYDDDPDNSYIYEIIPGYAFTEKFGVYIDYMNTIQKNNTPDNRIDVSLSFTINDYLYLDVYGGTSFNIKKFFFVGSTFSATIPF